MKYILLNIIILIWVLPAYSSGTKVYSLEAPADNLHFELVNGLILVPINLDQKEAVFILDSGTPGIIINRENINADQWYTSISCDLPAQNVILSKLIFGPVRKYNFPALEMNLKFVEDILDREIDGIIGSEILEDNDVVIDFVSRSLTFLKSGSTEGIDFSAFHITKVEVDMLQNKMPVVELKIDGELKRLAFDTGAGINVLHNSEPDEEEREKTISIQSIAVEKALFVDHDLSFLQSNGDADKIDGIISAVTLNADKIIISLKRNSIFLLYKNGRIGS